MNNISKLGRVTSGVKLINMDDNITVASIARVRECENEIEKDIFSQLEGEDKEGIEIDKVEE